MTKKTTIKAKSPAPATEATKPTRSKASKESVAKATPAPVSITGAPAATPAPKAPTAKVANTTPTIIEPTSAPTALKAVLPAKVVTKIVAKVDVGYGNALFIRGAGPGLSWDQGVAMECVAADQWEYVLGEAARPISFKVLVNDTLWCDGADQVVASGSTVTVSPEFVFA